MLCQIPVKSLQVEIERRYAAVLHHTVKRMAEGMTPQIVLLLAAPGPDEDYLAVRAEPLVRSFVSKNRRIGLKDS